MCLWNCLLRPSVAVDACLALSRFAPCAGAPLRSLSFFRGQCGGPCVDLSVVPSATHATASTAQKKSVSYLTTTHNNTQQHTTTHNHNRNNTQPQQPQQPPQPTTTNHNNQTSRHGCPSCRGGGSSVASQVPTFLGDLAGEARRQPEPRPERY